MREPNGTDGFLSASAGFTQWSKSLLKMYGLQLSQRRRHFRFQDSFYWAGGSAMLIFEESTISQTKRVLGRLRPKTNTTCPTWSIRKLGLVQASNGILYIVAWTQALSIYKTLKTCCLSQLGWFYLNKKTPTSKKTSNKSGSASSFTMFYWKHQNHALRSVLWRPEAAHASHVIKKVWKVGR